ncbi:ATP-dependent DNA ligase [Mesorhizobium sp.]|uniref:ATP-dependent DNA ligase n=1 Tax=Mesorhizobium sp. TaxID=1871066 RepID=UPI000FE37A86|nr:ATP-dependent DNA ligase [Mesorhizobium sp.]RWN56161.1 MAG: ATP-dependent DNA ligase [Mesorhizobium sp.]RWN76729.1 MAG: ATP-dependent DNA ligase [Mesorhizobium sp.]RWN81302.1 MAG: ATP-dependent DNA ligase [Mesorhizobium sp.]RWN90300.1 MAG: ATP-dependent DNA ligase [Mesorhizobium sp.]RWO15305.1 MAG: ATP-dependent DNA ligase [Mesorhizobium sp.]
MKVIPRDPAFESTRRSSDFLLPLDTPPMEAKAADAIPEGDGWQYERKWDGFRCLAFRQDDAVELRAKSGKPLGRYFPELLATLKELPSRRFVVDGEIVISVDGKFSFDALQMRLHPAENRIRKLSAETPASIVLFDMLCDQHGTVWLARTLKKRRAILEAFVASANRRNIVLSHCTRDVKEARSWLVDAGHGATDGVVAKRLDGPYQPGMRAMVKVKRLRSADCVVGGFRYLSSSRQVGSLLLGLYNEAGKLDHVGFTSTIAKEDRAELTRKLEAMREPPGFTGKAPGGPSRWSTERSGEWEPVRPELVVEVRFDHVTGDRFRHGTKFLRWRPDKAPEQCTLEQIA